MDRRSFLVAAAAAPFVLRAPPPLAYATADTETQVVVVDLSTGTVLHRIPTRPDPRSIERVGDLVVVAHTAVGAVSVLHGLVVRHVLDSFEEPRYTAASPDGRHAFVTDSGRAELVTFLRGRAFVTSGNDGTLRVYDEASARLLHTTRVPVGSYNVQFAAGRVLTPSLNAGTLCVLDANGSLRERVR